MLFLFSFYIVLPGLCDGAVEVSSSLSCFPMFSLVTFGVCFFVLFSSE